MWWLIRHSGSVDVVALQMSCLFDVAVSHLIWCLFRCCGIIKVGAFSMSWFIRYGGAFDFGLIKRGGSLDVLAH